MSTVGRMLTTVPSARSTVSDDTRIVRNDPRFRRIGLAMFGAGAAVFALLYGPQALLPQLSAAFDLTPPEAGLAMSLATAALAAGVVPAGALSELWGRRRVLVVSVILAALLGAVLPFSPSFAVLLVGRALQGLAMAGMPGVALAYLADEIHPSCVAGAVGTFVAGNGAGGLVGRMLSGAATDIGGWRAGLATVDVLSAVCAIAFAVLLLPQRNASGRSVGVGALRRHLADPPLRRLMLSGFVIMAGFVSMYNYLGYRLLRPPFALSTTMIGLIFLAYLAGVSASALAGRFTDHVGPRKVLLVSVAVATSGAATTIFDDLTCVLTGLTLVTVGFFGAHAVASGWVGRLAKQARGQAAGLYLFGFYAGGSLGGWAGGLVYERGGWSTTVVFMIAMFVVALVPLLPVHTPKYASRTRGSSASSEALPERVI